MDKVTENTIRQEQLASYGQLIAGFSHDMKNHLGIIRESNGLMGDLIDVGGLGEDEKSVERLKKAMASIERRVIIAANMLHHLSSFAHRSDTPYSSFQINDLITEECTFLVRFSKLQQVNFALQLEEGIHSLYNDPSLLQHVFYRMYILSLERLSIGDNFEIITKQSGRNVEITFRIIGHLQKNLEELFDDNIMSAIKKLKGVLKIDNNIKGIAAITLSVAPLSADNK